MIVWQLKINFNYGNIIILISYLKRYLVSSAANRVHLRIFILLCTQLLHEAIIYIYGFIKRDKFY